MPERAWMKSATWAILTTVVLVGCGDDPGGSLRRRATTPNEPTTTIWVGGDGATAIFLTPLSSESRSAKWQSARLGALIGDGQARSFHLLRIANLGPDSAPLPLTGIALQRDVGGVAVAWDDLRDVLQRSDVRTSTLAYRALSTYEGKTLRGGETLDGVVAFPGSARLSEGIAMRVELAGREYTLVKEGMTATDLRGLLEHPTRDLILASLPTHAVEGEGTTSVDPVPSEPSGNGSDEAADAPGGE